VKAGSVFVKNTATNLCVVINITYGHGAFAKTDTGILDEKSSRSFFFRIDLTACHTMVPVRICSVSKRYLPIWIQENVEVL
jgi:hypothetical protein